MALPDHVSKADLARAMGVSTVTITQWVGKGCPFEQKGSPGRPWLFSLPDVVAWREDQIQAQAVGDTTKLDLNEARRRKLAAEAAHAELDLAKRRGELVEIAEVAAAVGDDYTNLRAKLLALPVRLAPQCVGITNTAEVQATVEKFIHEALEELVSDGVYSSAAESAGQSAPDPTTAAD